MPCLFPLFKGKPMIKELRVNIEDALESMKFDPKKLARKMSESAPDGWRVGGDRTDLLFDDATVEGDELVLTNVRLTNPEGTDQENQAADELYWSIQSTGDEFMMNEAKFQKAVKADADVIKVDFPQNEPTFHDGKFLTAQDKANIYKAFARFIKGEFDPRKFTKSLYQHLSGQFGFIAHYDLGGFYHARFGDPEGRMKTFAAVMNASQWNFNDENTSGCGDLNKAIQELVRKNKTLFVEKAKGRKVEQILEQRRKLDDELMKLGHKVESKFFACMKQKYVGAEAIPYEEAVQQLMEADDIHGMTEAEIRKLDDKKLTKVFNMVIDPHCDEAYTISRNL